MKKTGSFRKDRETKNTIRYQEQRSEYIGQVYIQKATFNGEEPPEVVYITISDEDPSAENE